MSKETELSDEQIKIAAGQWAVNVMGEENLLRISRQVIAADHELRRGEQAVPELPPAVKLCEPAWGFTASHMHEYAQAALAAKDVELDAELKDRVALAMQIEGLRKDAERLDFLDAMEGGKWIARQSVTGRGFRVHQSSDASFNTVREAIDAAIAKEAAK